MREPRNNVITGRVGSLFRRWETPFQFQALFTEHPKPNPPSKPLYAPIIHSFQPLPHFPKASPPQGFSLIRLLRTLWHVGDEPPTNGTAGNEPQDDGLQHLDASPRSDKPREGGEYGSPGLSEDKDEACRTWLA